MLKKLQMAIDPISIFLFFLFYELFNVHIPIAALQWLHNWTTNYFNFFILMPVTVRLASNYEKN